MAAQASSRCHLRGSIDAQQRGRGAAQPPAAPETPPTPRAAAPIDLTGYWVSVITEDWRWRMVTAPKGDYTSIPINQEARKVGDAWDPLKDEAAGEQCKAYGAPGLMRVPGRLNISWQDDNTLKVDTDAGRQTRLLHFGDWKSPGGEPTLQGDTTAAVGNAGRPSRSAAAAAGAALRQPQDGDDPSSSGVSAQERRARTATRRR